MARKSSNSAKRLNPRRDKGPSLRRATIWRRYGFAWVTGGFFLISLAGHWIFGWFAYLDESAMHGQAVSAAAYTIEMARDTLENWQSEFLQLVWQVGGLTLLYWVGSNQSHESDMRHEEKLDAILRAVSPDRAESVIEEIDSRLDRTD
jgi:hypothetical protein